MNTYYKYVSFKIQNEFMRSSFLPKSQPKITEISALYPLISNKPPGQKSL